MRRRTDTVDHYLYVYGFFFSRSRHGVPNHPRSLRSQLFVFGQVRSAVFERVARRARHLLHGLVTPHGVHVAPLGTHPRAEYAEPLTRASREGSRSPLRQSLHPEPLDMTPVTLRVNGSALGAGGIFRDSSPAVLSLSKKVEKKLESRNSIALHPASDLIRRRDEPFSFGENLGVLQSSPRR